MKETYKKKVALFTCLAAAAGALISRLINGIIFKKLAVKYPLKAGSLLSPNLIMAVYFGFCIVIGAYCILTYKDMSREMIKGKGFARLFECHPLASYLVFRLIVLVASGLMLSLCVPAFFYGNYIEGSKEGFDVFQLYIGGAGAVLAIAAAGLAFWVHSQARMHCNYDLNSLLYLDRNRRMVALKSPTKTVLFDVDKDTHTSLLSGGCVNYQKKDSEVITVVNFEDFNRQCHDDDFDLLYARKPEDVYLITDLSTYFEKDKISYLKDYERNFRIQFDRFHLIVLGNNLLAATKKELEDEGIKVVSYTDDDNYLTLCDL